MNHVPEDAGEEGHVAQQDAELRADEPLAVVLLLRAPHADGGTDAGQFAVVWHEERLLGEDGAPAAARVALEVAGDARLAAPALEDLAALVAEALVAHAERGEVFRHLGRDVRPSLEDHAALDHAVDFEIEEEAGERRLQGRAGGQDRCDGVALVRRRRREQRGGQQLLRVKARVAHVGQQGYRIGLRRERLEEVHRGQAPIARVAQILYGLTERVQIQNLVARTNDAVECELHGELLLFRLEAKALGLKRAEHIGRLVGPREPGQLKCNFVEEELS